MGLFVVVAVVAALGSGRAFAEGIDAGPSRADGSVPRAAIAPVRPPVARPLPAPTAPKAPLPAPIANPAPVPTAPGAIPSTTAAPRPVQTPFFVPAAPAPVSASATSDISSEPNAGDADGRPHEGRSHRHRRSPDDASTPRRERAHPGHKGDRQPRGDKPAQPIADAPPVSASEKPPVAVGDRPPAATAPDATRPAQGVRTPTANAAPGTAPAKAAETAAAPVAPIVVARPGAPSAAMVGLGSREMMVNQLVAIVPISRDGDLASDYGLSIDEEATIRSLGVRLVTFTVLRPRGLGDIIDLMSLDSRVQGAQPNFRYRTSGAAIAGVYPQDRMRIRPALGMASGAGVTVALIDTKVAEITSLVGHVAERVSVISRGGRGRHGTALAGLIADVAPSARLLSIEAFADDPGDPDSGVSTTLNLARALDTAIDRKADVINLSVAGPRDPLIGRLVRQALSRGIVVVAAAGNDGPDAPPRYPAAYDGVIAVPATDSRNQPYADGAQGTHVVVAAPGVDVRATVSEGVVGYVTGTSVSAAHVAGVAALLKERAPKLGSGEAKRLLKDTASPLAQGPGMVDAFAAVSRVTALAGR